MKNNTKLYAVLIGIAILFSPIFSIGQTCENVNDFESEVLGVLAPYSGFPGYFNDYGAPEYVAEGCPVGTGSQGVRLRASVDGGDGDGLGYTMTGGSVPQPTFLGNKTYQITGKKLYSEVGSGDYAEIFMIIRLSNLTNNGPSCSGPDCIIITEKFLDLSPGMCESWFPSFQFTSPGDFNHMIISFEAVSPNGGNELFIVIDDWCVEEVPNMICEPIFEFFEEDCGKIQFTNLTEGGSVVKWDIEGPNGIALTFDDENPCVQFDVGGGYSVTLTVLCENGETITSEPLFFEVESNFPPFFEGCPEGQLIEIEGVIIEEECIGEYTFPTILAFDDGVPIMPTCTFDGQTAIAGQLFSRPVGIYDVVCTIDDGCNEPVICFYQVEISCTMEPCDYSCCTEGPNFPVEDRPLGSLIDDFQTGYFTVYGDPEIVADGCDGSSQAIELFGVTQISIGEAAGIKMSGIAGVDTIFKFGKMYCITFCMKVSQGVNPATTLELQATSDIQTDNSCSGHCEVIGTSDVVNLADGWTQQRIIYTPSADYEQLIFLNKINDIADGPLTILFDNVCISEAQPIFCEADFTIEDQGCGKMVFTADVCGEVESLVWLWDDGFESFESSDTSICHEYTSIGPWTVDLIVNCTDGTVDTLSKTFTTSADTIAPVLICPNDTIIQLSPEGDCTLDYLVGNYIIDDATATVTCYQSGILIPDPTLPITIQEGLTEISYVAQDSCGNLDSCAYTIELSCDPVGGPKYDCPIDVLFIMDNSGSISPSEYSNMASSALAEITAISSVYTNSKFGVVHYSGPCGDQISIEHDFGPPAAITAINRQFSTVFPGFMDDLNEALDAVINAYTGVSDPDNLSGSFLSPDPLADFYVVIFTDGAPQVSSVPGCTNSALLPYTNANVLKNTYAANMSVVHFVPSYADAECAAIASQGGTWTGAVDNNSGDPTNPFGPRQYIPASFSTPNIDLLTILPPCEPCYDCDDLEISSTETNADSCCYSIDFFNGIGTDIVKMEAEVISADWQFNTAATNPGTGYQWYPGTSPTANKVCITGPGNTIQLGANSDVLEYCFSEAVASPTGPQIVVFRWYSLLNDSLFELHCTDTLTTECIPDFNDPCLTVDNLDVDCNPENAYEYLVNITVTNTSGFNATHITMNGLDPGFLFANCSGGSGTTSLSIPIPGGLADGSSTTQCVKIIAPYPILNPQQLCFDLGIYSFFECCHSPEQVCLTIDPCCDPCEDILTTYSTLSVPDEDQCCYTISVDYSCDYLFFNKIKFTSTTPGVTFGYHALGNAQWQMCGSSSTELCVKPTTGLIAKGNYTNLLDICFDEINDVSQIPQTVRVDYITIDPATNLDSVACSDELTFECEIADNKCLEVTDQNLVCLPDSSKYQYTFTITNKSTLSFNATDVDVFIFAPSDLYFDPSGGTFPFTSPLGTNQSETITACIKSTGTFPSSASDIVLGYRLRFNAGDTCCYESVLDTLPLPPCDDICCVDEDEFLTNIAMGFQITDLGDCTYQVCANQFDTCHWFGTLGPDWGDGTGAPSAIVQSDPPNNCWTHTYTSPGPHKVAIYVFEGDFVNDEICWGADLCSTIENDCAPPPGDCFTVLDVEVKDVQCDTTDCYETPFCLPWLLDEISNLQCIGIPTAKVEKAYYNGQPVFVLTSTYLDLIQTRIFTCEGIMIQDCSNAITLPITCNPDAGIDITTDLTSVLQIWDCNDSVPIYDPLLCSSLSGTTVDYCVKIMNNYPSSFADQIDLQAYVPSGAIVSPSSIPVSIPSSGMTTINFTVSGPVYAGDVVKIEGLLSGMDSNDMPFECMDTICVEIPECPQDECCEDEDLFDANIAQGFTVTQLGDCTYQVCANQFDTCHWFSQPIPDWGDGSVALQVLTQSNPPNNCWTHTYSQSGMYTISIGVAEYSSIDEEPCWSDGIFTTVSPDCCEEDPCEGVDIFAQPISTDSDSCCYDFTIENNFCDDYFKGIRIEVSAPVSISQITGLSGYVINQLSPTVAEIMPLSGFIPMGTVDAFNLCTTNYTTNPHLVQISWLVPGPGGSSEEICPSEIEIGCEIDPPFEAKCFELVADSIHCESETYCFKIKNVSQPAFDIYSVDIYDVTGTAILSPSGRISIPKLVHGATSDWICVNYSGVTDGDQVCYKVSAHNTPANLPPTTCCTDTVETCFTIPPCDGDQCASCPAGYSTGSNQIINGDFETGSGYSGGWYSGYDLKLSGLMGSNEYSIRNSTDLVNGQWAATDHTTGSSTGNFLAIDGRSTNIAYGVPVSVQPNTNYIFCMWVDNLITTSIASAPIIRIDIGSTNVLAGQVLPKNPDGWQLITINYFSGSTSGIVDIKVRDIATSGFNDWAIDDVSFVACSQIVEDCCTALDTNAFCTYYDANISVSANTCEGCVTVDLDSCDIAFVDFGPGFISVGDNQEICNDFGGNGSYPTTVLVQRFDDDGNLCFEKEFDYIIDILNCPPVEDCCSALDTNALCAYYEANIVVSSTACEGCVVVDIDSCDVAFVDFGSGYIQLSDSQELCNDFGGNGSFATTVLIQRFDDDGNLCFEKEFDYIIEINECPPIEAGTCIALIEGELNCSDDSYCFRVVNQTANPGFTFASIALINETTGISFSPDPISLGGDLVQGDTSSIICVTISGANIGDEICFDLVAHHEDLTIGEEPTFCCADTVSYCFDYDCVDEDCCDFSESALNDYLENGSEFTIQGCDLCLPFDVDSCMLIDVDFGDGNLVNNTGGGSICNTYLVGGTYPVNIHIERLNSMGEICLEKDTVFEVNVMDCTSPPECDIDQLKIYNAMTPNNDGLNDNLVLEGIDNCARNIKIYNRWGQMVWSQNNYANDWSGLSFSGEKLPDGTYFLIVELPNEDAKDKRMVQTFIDLRGD